MTRGVRIEKGRQTLAVLGIGFYCLFTNLALQTVLPFLYLLLLSGQDSEVKLQFELLSQLPTDQSTEAEEIRAQTLAMRPLMERVPWGALGLVSSALLCLPLGWLAERFLLRPELSGLLLATASVFGQNPALTPLLLENAGFGEVALPQITALLLVFAQFGFLSVGILWSRGRRLLEQECDSLRQNKEKEEKP